MSENRLFRTFDRPSHRERSGGGGHAGSAEAPDERQGPRLPPPPSEGTAALGEPAERRQPGSGSPHGGASKLWTNARDRGSRHHHPGGPPRSEHGGTGGASTAPIPYRGITERGGKVAGIWRLWLPTGYPDPSIGLRRTPCN